MLSGIKCDNVCINLNDFTTGARHLKSLFLVNNFLYRQSFCFHSTQTDSYRFFAKLILQVSLILC